MCGILGHFHVDPDRITPQAIDTALQKMHHRDPDDQGHNGQQAILKQYNRANEERKFFDFYANIASCSSKTILAES